MVFSFLAVVMACLTGPQDAEPVGIAPAGFSVLATIDVGAAPHGIRFSADGRHVFVAVSGDDEIAVIDCVSMEVSARLPAGSVPSLCGPRVVHGLAPLSFEFADSFALFDTVSGEVRAQYSTGSGPHPADVTRDGVLAFVPNRGDATVSVIDLLNCETAATVPVGLRPEGGALLEDDTTYVVACGGSDELVWINTASYRVVHRTEGVGPRPFSVATTPDGRFLMVNNAGADTLSIVDVASRSVVGSLAVGEQPIAVRVHPDGRRAFVSNEVSGTVSVVSLPAPKSAPAGGPASGPAGELRNEVLVLGTIHGGHLTSERYGLDLLRELIRAIDPDVLLTEIPPNRAAEAMRGWLADGEVTEPRVARFPEYVQVVYPLLREGLDYEIVPTAGWTAPMARFRSERLAMIEADETRASEWAAYSAANETSDACLAEHGAPDDPRFIHTEAYDACNDLALAVYDELFNDELGPGGWTAINEAHYANIAAALDSQRGAGKRFLIIYGAGHKGWFRRALAERDDIQLLSMDRFIDQAQAALDGR